MLLSAFDKTLLVFFILVVGVITAFSLTPINQKAPWHQLMQIGVGTNSIADNNIILPQFGGTGIASCPDNNVLAWDKNGAKWVCGGPAQGAPTQAGPNFIAPVTVFDQPFSSSCDLNGGTVSGSCCPNASGTFDASGSVPAGAVAVILEATGASTSNNNYGDIWSYMYAGKTAGTNTILEGRVEGYEPGTAGAGSIRSGAWANQAVIPITAARTFYWQITSQQYHQAVAINGFVAGCNLKVIGYY